MSNTAEIAVVPLTAPDQGCHVPEHGCEGRASHAKTGTPFGAAQDAPPVGSPSLAGKGLGVRSASEWLRSLAAGAAKVLANAAQGNSTKSEPSEKADPPAKNDNVWAKLWDLDFADLEKLFQTQTTEEAHSAGLADSAQPSASPPPPSDHGSGANAGERAGNPGANAATPAPELSSEKQHANRAALDHLAAQWMANGFGRGVRHTTAPVVELYNSEIDPWIIPTTPHTLEGSAAAGQFTVYRTGPFHNALTVYYAVSGNAIPNVDYVALSGSVTIGAGQASAVINVTPIDDNDVEYNEAVIVTLLPHFSYVLGMPVEAAVVIIDDDLRVNVEAADAYAAESRLNTGGFVITRNGLFNESLTVYYNVAGTADAGVDYDELFGSVVIPAGYVGVAIRVFPIDDETGESAETIILSILSNPSYGIGPNDTATVTLLDDDYAGAGNHPPDAQDDEFELAEDDFDDFDVLDNDSDEDEDELTIVELGNPYHGSVVLNVDQTITYTPFADWYGTDSFYYLVSDGNGKGRVAEVIVTVTPVNDAPEATDDYYGVHVDQAINVPAIWGVLLNDWDVDGDELTAVLVADVSYGTLTLNADGSFEYEPNSQYVGEDSFTYYVTDGTANSNTTTVTLNVHSTNNDPTGFEDVYFVKANTETSEFAAGGNVLFNDFDEDFDVLTAVLVDDVSHGTLTLNPDGSFTYVPDAGYVGEDEFTYEIDDGVDVSDPVTVAIYVVNAVPEAGEDVYWIHHGETLAVDEPGVLHNDWDPDDFYNVTTVLVEESGPAHAQVFVFNADGSFIYTPEAGYVGTDSFQYRVFDGVSYSDPVSVTIHVENAAPVASDDEFYVLVTGSLTTSDTDTMDNDYDWDGDALTAILVNGPDYAESFTFYATGRFDYDPDETEWPTVTADTIQYKLTDGAQYSETVTVTIKWTDRPVARPDYFAFAEDTTLSVSAANGVLVNDFLAQGSSIEAVLVSGPHPEEEGVLTLQANGSFTFEPAEGFDGTAEFTYYVRSSNRPDSPNQTVQLIGPGNIILFWEDSVKLKQVAFKSAHPPILRDNPAQGQSLAYRDPQVPGAVNAQWYDSDGDGDADDEGDHQWPVSITRNTKLKVDVVFTIDPAKVHLWKGNVLVRANGPGNIDLGYAANVPIKLKGNELVLQDVEFDNAFANKVQYFDAFELAWRLSPQSEQPIWLNFVGSTTSNEVYVTYATPDPAFPLYHTLLHLSTPVNHDQDNADEIIKRVWAQFEKEQVYRRPTERDQFGMPIKHYLKYYGEWTTRNGTVQSLIRDLDGMCGAWGQLFVNTLLAQKLPGIGAGSLRGIQPRSFGGSLSAN